MTEEKTFKVFITKYALTKGIYELEVIQSPIYPDMIFTPARTSRAAFFRGQWHRTLAEAQEHANNQREKKIKLLEKQIEKLKKMVF